MNREKFGELHEAQIIGEALAGSDLVLEILDSMISKVEDHLVVLNGTVVSSQEDVPKKSRQATTTYC